NTKEFVIEKSKNAIDWLPTGKINSIGFSNQLNNYSFSDCFIQNISYYYRLKIIDFDNAFEYSSVIYQPRNTNNTEFIVYPNPTNGNLNIQFSADQNKNSELVVKNLLGQTVKTIQINVVSQNNLISVDCNDLPNGTYFINILELKEFNHVIKFLKY
ncbi:MAG TPA: T9SS type A sorting domain-containing protein, partial [Chitinophagales bacterium]|nr:T9SS type A sorting domain-containing protein [Chitinophagales bacterium]